MIQDAGLVLLKWRGLLTTLASPSGSAGSLLPTSVFGRSVTFVAVLSSWPTSGFLLWGSVISSNLRDGGAELSVDAGGESGFFL